MGDQDLVAKTPATGERPGAWPPAAKELIACVTLSGMRSNG